MVLYLFIEFTEQLNFLKVEVEVVIWIPVMVVVEVVIWIPVMVVVEVYWIPVMVVVEVYWILEVVKEMKY